MRKFIVKFMKLKFSKHFIRFIHNKFRIYCSTTYDLRKFYVSNEVNYFNNKYQFWDSEISDFNEMIPIPENPRKNFKKSISRNRYTKVGKGQCIF